MPTRYSEPMLARVVRLAGAALTGAAAVWFARLLAHSKVPPPEGRWRELRDEDRHRA